MSKWIRINLKLALYLIFILKYPVSDEDEEKLRWISFCTKDLKQFPNIFYNTTNCCATFLTDIDLQSDVGSNINKIFGNRKIQYGYQNGQNKIVVKHILDESMLQRIESKLCENDLFICNNDMWNNPKTREKLKRLLPMIFHQNQRIDGIQIYPSGSYSRLVQIFQKFALNDLYLWFLINMNLDPLFLTDLHRHGFPVPVIYSTCGFVLLQSYNGASLYDFYQHSYVIRVYIAKQLLEAAVMFTEGLHGYRVYLTDATPDNIVVDSQTYKATFIDLDNVILVDSKANETNSNLTAEWNQIHQHEKIECDGCFAYIPEEMAQHHQSDINIFAICQLLNEDLYGNIENGFLHTIPLELQNKYPELPDAISDCMHCTRNCDNRFKKANEILQIFDGIVRNFRPFQSISST